ncbi:hypothetical protein [Castellaniella sp.]|uniref:hypothetical protein n=1 Tax=Castellaniella sp. TaxID=1955812 RepID=UPI003C7718F3
MKLLNLSPLLAVLLAGLGGHASAQDVGHPHGITTKADAAVEASFDIVRTRISSEGRTAIFQMAVSGEAGALRPAQSGKLAGSSVFSYVWPTSLDPSVIGFEAKAGILAFAVTSHPDFDDTPLFDENGDGKLDNDGDLWHSHWVVLQPDAACGKDALKAVDIPEGAKPRVPKTWPGLPILIDSPGWTPVFKDKTVNVRVPFDDISAVEGGSFDGVTAALRVNASVHSPLLCVANVFKVASGDLSLPGKVNK